MRPVALAMLLLAAVGPARADYVDPWGLPSGSATLRLALQDSIQAGGPVWSIDFASGQVDSLSSYPDMVAAGLADLVFLELAPGESDHWLRGPEDPIYGMDRYVIVDLGERGIETVANMMDEDGEPLLLDRFVPAAAGHSYGLLQVQVGAAVETTAVKLELTALADSSASFDWAWQPNGSREFIPTAREPSSFGAVKARY